MIDRRPSLRLLALILLLLVLASAAVAYAILARNVNFAGFIGSGSEAEVSLPEGFTIDVFASGLNAPRFIAFGPDGALYVADRGNNRIVALEDGNGDGRADREREFAADLNRPHSLVYHEDGWYVGVPSGVIRLRDTTGDGVANERTVIVDNLPAGGSHTTRTVDFLPDGRMVVSVGSSCNVCREADPRRAAIVIYDDASGRGERLYATGLRNAVGLAVQPESGQLWATNNGRDLMGDDLPPETVYIIRDGADYGWPFCHSGRIVDPDLGFDGACDGVEPPVVEMQAHSAPLGLIFYPPDAAGPAAFPADFHGDLFIAFHGSWNRSEPTGYKVVRVPFDGLAPAGALVDFAAGWLREDGQVDGRPVGLAVGPDGALYVSDDKGGFIYRIAYRG